MKVRVTHNYLRILVEVVRQRHESHVLWLPNRSIFFILLSYFDFFASRSVGILKVKPFPCEKTTDESRTYELPVDASRVKLWGALKVT